MFTGGSARARSLRHHIPEGYALTFADLAIEENEDLRLLPIV